MTRLVIRAPNWLGDAVMALPAMAAVRARYHGAHLTVAARPSVAPLFLEDTPVAPDAVLAVDRAREAEQLRGTGADAVLLLPNSFGSAWTARRAGVPERWGYRGAGRRPLLTRSIRRPRQRVHQVEYYLSLVRGLGIAAADGPPRLAPHRESAARAETVLGAAGWRPGERLVGFAPGAAYGHAKRWPPARVAEVVAALAARGIVPVLVGAAADRESGRAIESALPPGTRVVNVIGRTDLRQLVGVVARCAAFVSNDSGAMHVAAALGVPLVALFGPTDERVTAPSGPGARTVLVRPVFCRPCMLRECPIDHRCMTRILAADVLAAIDATSRLS
jgi:heptosyltransferase-2